MVHKKIFALALVLTLIGIIGFAGASDLTPKEQLGKSLFFDKISDPDWMSCATCHDPDAGWTGPIAGINERGAVYRGAVPVRFGNRKPPSAAYATFSPVFYYDDSEELFFGGNFWDGRATGEYLGNPAADQALGPFLNPVEQNNPSKLAVLEQVASSKYAGLWEEVWGAPINFADVDLEYGRIGLAIKEYEASSEVNQFSSKYDAFLQGEADLTEQELSGLELFEGEAMCAECHPTGLSALFTDFSYDNLGIPKNPENPFYDMDEVYLDDGTPINPEGSSWIDLGLGGFLDTLPESYFTGLGLDKEDTVEGNYGKHKVPTLRNVDKRPGQGFIKAYGHNGYFKSLEGIVHFYNTRDVLPVCSGDYTEAQALAANCWPPPEVSQNVNMDELGDLDLDADEEAAIVAFLKTLSDSYKVKKK